MAAFRLIKQEQDKLATMAKISKTSLARSFWPVRHLRNRLPLVVDNYCDIYDTVFPLVETTTVAAWKAVFAAFAAWKAVSAVFNAVGAASMFGEFYRSRQ